MPCVTIGHQSPSFSGGVVTINVQGPAACEVNSIVGPAVFLVVLHSVRGEVQSVSKQIIRCILKGIQNPSK